MQNLKKLGVLTLLLAVVACGSTKQGTDASDTTSASEGKGSVKVINSSNDFNKVSVVYFDFDKSNIKDEEARKLDVQAKILAEEEPNITIEGHTDYLGTSEYNLALGERRATSTKNYLIKKGVEADSIKTVSYGETRQVDTAETDKARAKNRRTVTLR